MSSPPRSGRRPGRILVVDDTPADLRLLCQLLSEHGYTVHPATEGELALRFVASTLPDLVLLDVVMRDLDGYEVCGRLKAQDRTRDVPVIFVSAADQVLDKVKAFASGAVDYVVKPFQAEEVLARIDTHLALRSLQRDLEARVQERTAELQQVNARLSADIEERWRVERALRASEERYRALYQVEAELKAALSRAALDWELTFDAMETPILILDGDGRILRLNRAAQSLSLQQTKEAALGQPVAALGPGQPWPGAASLVATTARSQSPVQDRVRDPVEGRTWDLTAGRSPAPDGGGDRLIVVARDVTRLTELQESLVRNETMVALGSLVAGVAHEVRNPLFGITANLDAFEVAVGGHPEHQETIAILRREAHRLIDLMKDLLDYGRPACESPAPESVEAMLGEAIRACARLAGASRLALKTPGPLPPVVADRVRMIQVFRNLIENAVQHSPPGGTVVVEADEVSHGGETWVVCAVKDSGPGFQAEELPRVFEPFFTRRPGGTGLGLSIARRIVDGHGGAIRGANRSEGGAVVTVTLPGAKSPPA